MDRFAQLQNLIVPAVLGLLLVIGAGFLLKRVHLMLEAPAHQRITSFDSHLPLRGRWLGYLLAVVLLPVACIAIFVGGMILLGCFVALLGALLSLAH